MSKPLNPIKLTARDAELVALYAEDLLTDQQAVELNARLHADPTLLSAIAQFAEIEEHLRALLDEEQASDDGDWFVVMSELAQAEARADVQTVHLPDATNKRIKPSVNQPSMNEVGQVLWTIGKQTKVWAPIAAVLVVALTLALLFRGGSDGPGPIADADQSPQETAPQPVAVATLTDQHNAQWAEGAIAAGDHLHAGQRLTLTAGSAEITTHRGAVAILEAPATVELLDHNNALRLHTGKLVGICETELSKGFLVRTTHLDITDLGTRFGVDATNPAATEVHVYEGEVEVAPPATGTRDAQGVQRLTARQALRSDPATNQLVRIDASFHAFSEGLGFTRLFGTGVGVEEGQPDPSWQIVADGKGPLDQPIPLRVKFGPGKVPHFPAYGNDPNVAQHLVYDTREKIYNKPTRPVLDDSLFTVQHRFEMDDAIPLQDATLYLKYASIELGEVRLNGQAVEPLPKQGNRGELNKTFHEVELPVNTTALRAGENIVEIDLPKPALRTQAPLFLYFYAELRPSAATAPGRTQP